MADLHDWCRVVFQAAGRLSIGLAAGTFVSFGLFVVARTYFLTTVQTAESAPHYEVLYAGLTGETVFLIACILPIAPALLSVTLIRRLMPRWLVVGSMFLAVVSCFGIKWMFDRFVWDALWLGMD